MPIPKQKLKKIVEELASNGCNVSAACEKYGISRQSFYSYRKKLNWVAVGFDAANNTATDNVRTSLYKTALEGNVTAMIFWLKNKARDEFADIHNVKNVNVSDIREYISGMNEKEREEYKQELIARLTRKKGEK